MQFVIGSNAFYLIRAGMFCRSWPDSNILSWIIAILTLHNQKLYSQCQLYQYSKLSTSLLPRQMILERQPEPWALYTNAGDGSTSRMLTKNMQACVRYKPKVTYSHGSRAIKWAPRAGCRLEGFGVPISLLFAILVLALANSRRSVWGFSGSKRIPL